MMHSTDYSGMIISKLKELCLKHKNRIYENENSRLFSSYREPSISIKDYLKRIIEYFECEESTCEVAYEYICRFGEKRGINIDDLNMHRILLIAFSIARKYVEEDHYEQTYYACVGGISAKELLRLELAFCEYLDWNLYAEGTRVKYSDE